MSASLAILRDIKTAMATNCVADRTILLRHVTDLFIVGGTELLDEDVAAFDDVLGQLVVEIEASARALLALRLAPIAHAPPNIIRTLAFDADSDVAGPVLTQSERLDEPTLVSNAGSMSQNHLFAISMRRSLTAPVTDVLVERGDAQVVLSVTQNAGANFSEAGFARLVDRAEGDDALAAKVGIRPDIPWHHFANLLARASSHVRAKLEAEAPSARREIKQAVGLAAAQISVKYGDKVSGMTPVAASLAAMHREGELDDEQIRCFAEDGLLEQVVVSLCLLADLPRWIVEEGISEDSGETLLVLAKATGLSWATTKAIMQLPTGRRPRAPSQLRQCLAGYEKLSRSIAEQILQFHRGRASRDEPSSGSGS